MDLPELAFALLQATLDSGNRMLFKKYDLDVPDLYLKLPKAFLFL